MWPSSRRFAAIESERFPLDRYKGGQPHTTTKNHETDFHEVGTEGGNRRPNEHTWPAIGMLYTSKSGRVEKLIWCATPVRADTQSAGREWAGVRWREHNSSTVPGLLDEAVSPCLA